MKKLGRPLYFAILVFLACLIFVIEAFSAKHLNYVLDFVGYGGTFKNHDLKIIGLPAYWFLMILGLVINISFSYNHRQKYGFNRTQALLAPVIFLIACFLGGKLLYLLETYRRFGKVTLGFDGLSLFGAIFAVPLVAIPVSRITKRKYSVLLDMCAPFGLVLLSCVRTGCFINGCCEASTFWYGYNPVILPIQLMEVYLDLLILELCLFVNKKQSAPGLVYPTLMICYGFCRFLLEYLRNTPREIWIFTNGQAYSLICILIGGILFAHYRSHAK